MLGLDQATGLLVTPLVLKFGGELLEERSPAWDAVGRRCGFRSPRARPFRSSSFTAAGRKSMRHSQTAGIEKAASRGTSESRTKPRSTSSWSVSGRSGEYTVSWRPLSAAGTQARGTHGCGRGRAACSAVAPPHRTVDGRAVDLGRVGLPAVEGGTCGCCTRLLHDHFVPVVARHRPSTARAGSSTSNRRYDGRTPGRKPSGAPAESSAGSNGRRCWTPSGPDDPDARIRPRIGQLVSGGTATAGMIAKLRACEQALGRRE